MGFMFPLIILDIQFFTILYPTAEAYSHPVDVLTFFRHSVAPISDSFFAYFDNKGISSLQQKA